MSQPASFPPQRGGASQLSPTTVTPAPQAAVEAPEPGASETAATSSSPVLTVSSPEPPAVPGGEKKDTKVKKAVAGPRRVKLSLTHVDPWSVMKVSFLLSVAAGIMLIVAAAVVWFVLDAMHVFSTIQDLVAAVMDKQSNSFTALVEYLKFSRAISMATVIAVVNIILATALSTIGAFLYNITATLVGGVHLTLADE